MHTCNSLQYVKSEKIEVQAYLGLMASSVACDKAVEL